jgi:hypothetical protein
MSHDKRESDDTVASGKMRETSGKGKRHSGSSHDEEQLSHDKGNTRKEVEMPQADTAKGVVFLPPVDSVSVSRIQRSLFNSQLRQHLQKVCSTLNLSVHQVLPQVVQATSQFR